MDSLRANRAHRQYLLRFTRQFPLGGDPIQVQRRPLLIRHGHALLVFLPVQQPNLKEILGRPLFPPGVAFLTGGDVSGEFSIVSADEVAVMTGGHFYGVFRSRPCAMALTVLKLTPY